MTLPAAIAAQIAGEADSDATSGRSLAHTRRVRLRAGGHGWLKSAEEAGAEELRGEAERLAWLAQRAPAPRLIARAEADGRVFLLTEDAPGADLAASGKRDPLACVDALAAALRALHALPVADCPFDGRVAAKLARAEENLRAGRVRADNFDAERRGRDPAAIWAEFRALPVPREEALVVAHGDACLPNFVRGADGAVRFIDLGRLGVADRWQDLALAAWSVDYNLGPNWVAPFLAAYGVAPDPARQSWFRFLDEFF